MLFTCRNFAVVLGAFVLPKFALASDVKINAFLNIPPCSEPQVRTGHFEVLYSNTALPPNSRVTLHLGWEVKQPDGSAVDWQQIGEVLMDVIGFGTWNAPVERDLESDKGETLANAMNFVFKIQYPDGGVGFDKGNSSRLGFYRAGWKTFDKTCSDSAASWPLNLSVLNFIRN
jgi:hypothetical protein